MRNGFLIVQVPNKNSFQSQIFKENWAAFDVPRDLYYFKIETVCSLLRKTGFQVTKIDHFMNWLHPPTLVISLFPDLNPQSAWREESRGRYSLLKRGAWVFFTLLVSPLTQLESGVKRGAIVTYYSIKK